MKSYCQITVVLVFLSILGCTNKNDDGPTPTMEEAMYFPPSNSSEWKTRSLTQLNWNTEAEAPLYAFLEASNTDAFMLLKDGKIVIEKYFGTFTANKTHSWNSAAKTLTAFTVGIAQKEGLLSINNSSSDYLGLGWSQLTQEQEQKITVENHLTMTTGLDYIVPNNFCTDKDCPLFKNEPNTFWYYHNSPYTLLEKIVSGAVDQDFNDYFNSKIRDRIGMQGKWIKTGYLNLYFSDIRSMARFGLLNLNKGIWDGNKILDDTIYFTAMTSTSQDLNKSYGYLWWLNGKENYRLPGSEELYPKNLIPNAPADLIAGLGAFDQKLYVVPSQGLVIVRFGDSAYTDELGPTTYDNDLWKKINDLID